jgi:hypothetical protein
MTRRLEDYVDVATRIQRFYERFPEGSLQSELLVDDGKRIVMKGCAFRSADDLRRRSVTPRRCAATGP